MQPRTVILCLALLLTISSAARAQDIPSDIPDAPEPLDEKVERRLVERHRGLLSGFFATSSLGLSAPVFNVAAGRTFQVGGGFMLSGGDAIYSTVRSYRLEPVGESGEASLDRPDLQGSPVYELSVRYDKSLRELLVPEWGRRMSVAFGAGVLLGEVDGFSMTVTPQYTLPINRRWSLPLGVTVGGTVLTETTRHLFVGVHAGVRVHLFGWYEQMQ